MVMVMVPALTSCGGPGLIQGLVTLPVGGGGAVGAKGQGVTVELVGDAPEVGLLGFGEDSIVASRGRRG